MPRIITLTMELTDEEFTRTLERFGRDATLDVTMTDDDGGPVDAGAPDVDSKGVAWNAEIHASSKARNADGTWRKKRGVTDEQVAAVVASAPVPQPEPTAPVAPVAPALPELPGLPTFTPPVVVEPEPIVEYSDIVAKYQELVAAGKVKPEDMQGLYVKAEADATQLMVNETMRASLMRVLKAL